MKLLNYYIVDDQWCSSEELYHHGIKGMKWGVRRYQNADGSLTAAGRKRVSKEYKKTSKATMQDLRKQYNSMRLRAYNEAADYMNSGGIDKYNAQQRKRYGEKFAEREGYMEDYSKVFDKQYAKNFNKSLDDFYKTNKNAAKGRELVKKYDMTAWDDLAKSNSEKIEEVRRAVEGR